jgi:hypothetical protein
MRPDVPDAGVSHGLESQLLQSVAVPLKIFHGVVFVHVMGFEEPIEPVPGSKTEQSPQLGLGEIRSLPR